VEKGQKCLFSCINNTAPNLRAVMYSPRIYTYKITFEEVPYYYYGMHEENVYDEEYWGSPKTNKWCWELYTPKKQILELFDTRKNAYKVEKRLIKPFYRKDQYCLNAGCSDFYLSKQERIKAGKKSAKTHRKNKTGAFDPEKKLQSIGGKIAGKMNVESGHLQEISGLKYICLETGFISSARGLSVYQRKRNINLSKRRLLTEEEYREKTKRLFTVVSSTGEVFTDDDIDKFCKEHNLAKSLFVDLLDGKKISHMGFHLSGTELKFYVDFTVKTPDGKIVRANNISKFCRDYSTENCFLSVGPFHKLIKGKVESYKGYTLYTPNKDT
jgi:hypothetical protein